MNSLRRRKDAPGYVTRDERFVVEPHYGGMAPHLYRDGWKITDCTGVLVFGGVPTGRPTSITMFVGSLSQAEVAIEDARKRESYRARRVPA